MDINIILLFWGMLVGVVFSVIGAAGGILASFGLITLVGITDPNTVKPMAQMMTLSMVAVFLPTYMKRASCVIILGLMLAFGGMLGAWLGSTFSSYYLSDMNVFRPLFGLLALVVAIQVFWKLFNAPKTVEQPSANQGVHSIKLEDGRLLFVHAGRDFTIPIAYPILVGFLIAMVSAIFGVGGGFLLVPFMASMLGMPMYIVPATAAIPIFIGGAVSITNYLQLGAQPDYDVLILLALGGMLGALLGPRLNRLCKDYWLKVGLCGVISLIGVRYVLG